MPSFKKIRFLNHLITFEAAARMGNFTLAADSLTITRTAVSYQMKEIEKALGKPLFLRLNRSVKLTSEGEKLYAATTRVLQELLNTSEEIRGTSADRIVTITTTTGLSTYWLLPRIGRFREEHPDIQINIVVSDRYLSFGEDFDVAIRYFRNDQTDPDAIFLMGNYIAPTCSLHLSTDLDETSSLEDLRNERLIFLEGGKKYDDRSKWSGWFKAHDVKSEPMPRGLHVNDYVNLISTCEAGQGWALLGSPLIDAQLGAGVLRQPLSVKPLKIGNFAIKRHPRSKAEASVDIFCRWLIASINNPSGPVLGSLP